MDIYHLTWVLLPLLGRVLPPTDARVTGPLAFGARSGPSWLKPATRGAELTTGTAGALSGGVTGLVAGVAPCSLSTNAAALAAGLVPSPSTVAAAAMTGAAIGGEVTSTSCSQGGSSSEHCGECCAEVLAPSSRNR